MSSAFATSLLSLDNYYYLFSTKYYFSAPGLFHSPEYSLSNVLVDCGCNLLSRRFEADQEKIIQRAVKTGVESMIVYCNDFEKQEAIALLSQTNTGVIYSCIGIHPDNIKRNDKTFASRLTDIKDWSLKSETVAILSGLDFSREFSTHFPQEKVFTMLIELAIDVELPLLIFDLGGATHKVVEILTSLFTPLLNEVNNNNNNNNALSSKYIPPVAIFNFEGSLTDLETYLALPFPVYFVFTGLCVSKNAEQSATLCSVLCKVPLEKLLIASDSPRFTPQNLDDAYLREQKNEPSNLPFVFQHMAKTLEIDQKILAENLRKNSKKFFNLKDLEELEEEKKGKEKLEVKEIDGKEEESEEEDATKPPPLPEKNTNKPPKIEEGKPTKRENKKKNNKKNTEEKSSREDSQKKIEEEENNINNMKKQRGPLIVRNSRKKQNKNDSPFNTDEEKEKLALENSPEISAVSSAMKYVCSKCRKHLFSSSELIPIENGMRELKELTQNDEMELNEANLLLSKEINWILNEKKEVKKMENETTTGLIMCPHCSFKIGKWYCSDSDSAFVLSTIKKKRVDWIVENQDERLLARMVEDEAQDENSDEENSQKSTKKKNRKKNVKQNNYSNMGDFRNKAFGKKDKKEELTQPLKSGPELDK